MLATTPEPASHVATDSSSAAQPRPTSPPRAPNPPSLQPPPTPAQYHPHEEGYDSAQLLPSDRDLLFAYLERSLRPAVDMNPATKWSAEKVQQWLGGVDSLSENTINRFIALKIDRFTLVRLSEEDLRTEVALPDRKRLTEAIQRLTAPLDATKEVAKFMEHRRRYLRPQQLVLINLLKDAGMQQQQFL